MSNPLVEALAPLNLELGRTCRCEVNGRRIEVRVLEEAPNEMPPAPFVESDVMLDAWVELPEPEAGYYVNATVGVMPPPDPPDIPVEEYQT